MSLLIRTAEPSETAAAPAPERHAGMDELARLRRRIRAERRRAMTVALRPHARSVGAALACGTHPGTRYWGDCYRRAGDFVLARTIKDARCPLLDDLTLVHGTCRASHVLWGHAWVELAGALVFDGVRQRFYDREGYYRVLQTVAEATYRPVAVAERLCAAGHYGPWHGGALGHETARRLEDADMEDADNAHRAGYTAPGRA